MSPATYAIHLLGYIRDDSAVAIHVNAKYDTREWDAPRVAALRSSLPRQTRKQRDTPERSTAEAAWARMSKRGSDKLRDAILAMLAKRR